MDRSRFTNSITVSRDHELFPTPSHNNVELNDDDNFASCVTAKYTSGPEKVSLLIVAITLSSANQF